MDKRQFKSGLNSELRGAGFANSVDSVSEVEGMTAMRFKSPLDVPLTQWLNIRFQYGISTASTEGNLAFVNPPNPRFRHGVPVVDSVRRAAKAVGVNPTNVESIARVEGGWSVSVKNRQKVCCEIEKNTVFVSDGAVERYADVPMGRIQCGEHATFQEEQHKW
jgi:hypothetical protein